MKPFPRRVDASLLITAGGCLNLIKGQGMLPGRRVAVVGNGPLVLVVASALIKGGAEVPVVAEAASSLGALAQLHRLALSPGLLAKGLDYRWTILRSGASFRQRSAVTRALGKDAVTAVEIAPLGRGAVSGAVERYDVDGVVVGYGLIPSVELTRLLGCEHEYRQDRGGWIPKRNAECETTVKGVFAVGDCAGVGGAEIALLEGRAAAEAIAAQLNGRPGPRSSARTLRLLTSSATASTAFSWKGRSAPPPLRIRSFADARNCVSATSRKRQAPSAAEFAPSRLPPACRWDVAKAGIVCRQPRSC